MKVDIGPYEDGDEERHVEIIIDKYDTWSMDHTLGLIALPMLKQLKKTKHGAPFVDMTDRPEHLQCYKEPEDFNTDKFHFEAWDWAMDQMIFSFESICGKYEGWEEQFYSGEHDRITVPVDKDGNEVPEEEAEYYEWRKGPNDTFEIDMEGRKAYQERINNGFRLFGKYYQSLWD